MGLKRALPAAVLFAGCSLASAALAQSEVRILAASSGSGLGVSALADQFNASQSDVKVVVEQVPPGDSYAQTVFTQIQAGAGPDIFLINSGYGAPESVLPLVASGVVADLTDQPWAKNVPESSFKGFWLDGKIYALPLSLMSVGYVYNVDLLKDSGLTLPATFNDLLAFCDAANAKGKAAVGVAGMVSFYFYESMAMDTVFVDDPDWSSKRAEGKTTFAGTPGWTEALKRVDQMKDHNCFQPGVQAASPAQLFADIAAGNVLGANGPTTLMGAVIGMNKDIHLAMVPMPGSTSDRTVAMGTFNEGLAVNAKSNNKKGADAFLAYLSQPENLAKYSSVAGGTAPADALSGNFPAALTAIGPYYKEGRVRSVPHNEWRATEMRSVLAQDGSAFFAGSKTSEQFLADLDRAWK